MNKPDISLAFSGLRFKANEKIIENTLAIAKPTIKTIINILQISFMNNMINSAGIATSILILKNLLAEKETNRSAPTKVPIVLAIK